MEPKMFGTREEYGVNTPHVLSMRSYAHREAKYAKNMLFYPSLGLMQSQVNHTNQPNMLIQQVTLI